MPMQFRTSKHFILLFLIISFFFFAVSVEGKIYKIITADGTIHLTDNPLRKSFVNSRKAEYYSSKRKVQRDYNEEKFSGIIDDVAEKYGIDRDLIITIIECESGFDPYAVSEKGAVGLMQLMPETAKRFGVEDRFNPKDNIQGGVAYIDYLMNLYDEKLDLVLAAYNAGEKAIEKHKGIPPFAETKGFVKRVLSLYDRRKGAKAYIVRHNDGTILITNHD
ncbi:MAG: lytic transglycosylase domain-containing protein [Candidatus Schekmanbacteria bacterium]|nr:MAG: lytic transglycosylase domain-containing protein [Candidatus Schekmanbacteria bacterium]